MNFKLMLGLLAVQPLLAEAKIPSAEFVFNKVTLKEKARSLRVKSKINNDGEIFTEILTVDFHRGIANLNLKTPDDLWLATKFLKISQSKSLPFFILFEGNPISLRTKLLELGFFIPLDRTSETKENSELKRIGKKYAWLFSSEDKKNSLWIEKDKFVPLRIETYRYDRILDVEYSDQRPSGGLLFPRKALVKINGKPTFQWELQEISVSPDQLDLGSDQNSKISNDASHAVQEWLRWMRE